MIPLPIQYEEVAALFAATVGDGHKSIAVASAEQGEGVSMVAYALARRASSSGRRTLLVDLNTERPSVLRRLGLESTNWKPGTESADTAMIELVGVNMSVLSAPTDPGAIMSARDPETLRKTVARWSELFDCVILDTSPLTRFNQGNILPDIAASCCNATILVVLAGRTPETKVSEAATRLKKAGATLVGTVLNDRHSPSLVAELCRETFRLERWLPRLMAGFRTFARTNAFLNQKI